MPLKMQTTDPTKDLPPSQSPLSSSEPKLALLTDTTNITSRYKRWLKYDAQESDSLAQELRLLYEEMQGMRKDTRECRQDMIYFREALGAHTQRIDAMELRVDWMEKTVAPAIVDTGARRLQEALEKLQTELHDHDKDLQSKDVQISHVIEERADNPVNLVAAIPKLRAVVSAERMGACGYRAGEELVVRLPRRATRDAMLRGARRRRGAPTADTGLPDVPKVNYKMDIKNKILLQQHQKELVRDLDTVYIIDELFTNKAISPEDFDHIFNLKNRTDRTRYLLDALITNGTNHSYVAFVDSLHKDYRWLWEKFAIDNMSNAVPDDSFEDSLSRGDVPRLPDHYVQRVRLEQEVSAKLRQLTRHKILALHGMLGSGKTSVVLGTLRSDPELVTGYFKGVVFWLNMGNVKTEDDIIVQQNKLHRKISPLCSRRDSSFMNSSISMSSIGSNADSQSYSSNEWTLSEYKDALKSLFAEPMLKESLLVLDEVNAKKIVDAFDVGCKVLVTIRDTDVVANFQPQIVRIENNFEEKESLQLFALCLDVEVSQLPRQAKKLHEICKGNPFHMTLIGAQLAENREKLIHDPSKWNEYINKLARKEFFFSYPRHSDKPIKTIEMCIKSLPANIQSKYKMLAVLPDNVKFTSEVISKLWKQNETDVESTMKQLGSKSLIIESYNKEQRKYLYEVHDIIMSHLRTCQSEDDIKKLHIDFLTNYRFNSLADSSLDLVDDGYIAYYIGHHIFHTQNMQNKWSLFKLYLNLKFLGRKVRLTGPADAILDLQKYENFIANDEMERELLFNIKAFLSTHGNDLYRFPSTDILQSILQHESKGTLYAEAYKLAEERCANNEVYFEFLHEQNVDEVKYTTIDVKENIISVCFLGDYVLVGTITGVIKVFHISTNKLKLELPCSGAPIKWIAPCPSNALIVAALTSAGKLQLCYMDDMDIDVSDNAIDEEQEEPQYKETPSTPVIIINGKLDQFVSCRWANNDDRLIAHTQTKICFYGTNGKLVESIDNFEKDKEIVCCMPTNDDRHLVIATCVGTTYYIESIDLKTKERVVQFEDNVPIVDVLNIPGSNKMLLLNENAVLEHMFLMHNSYTHNYNSYSSRKVISSDDVKENLKFISAVVNKSGTLLFVSTDDSRIICVCLKTNSYVFSLDNRRGNAVSMAMSEMWYDEFEPGSDVLLTGTGTAEPAAKVWYLDANYVAQATQKHRKVRLTTKYDVSFLQSSSPNTPSGYTTPPHDNKSTTSSPLRQQSFANHKDLEKKPARKTMSLDRHALKPLNLKGICNGGEEQGLVPMLAVIDDRNSIQIMRGRKVLTEIPSKADDKVTRVKISPCNQHIIIGLQSGAVKKYTMRTKETKVIMDIYSPIQYLNFVNPNLLIVAGKNRCLMAYRLLCDGWSLEMMQKGNMNLGSQEILNGIQGSKKKNVQGDTLSHSGSEASFTSKDRMFPSVEKGRLCNGSSLIECFWVEGTGLITVENNATVKLWSPDMKLVCVLNGRQADIYVNCAAFQKNTLVVCDDYGKLQIFELKSKEKQIYLQSVHESKVNYKIISCDLTADGLILAVGLDSGDVAIWNVAGKCQISFLRHHKSKVQACVFSPVPKKLNRSSLHSPNVLGQNFNFSNSNTDEEQPPLVLVTMASEIVWWDISYLIKMRAQNKSIWRIRKNLLSPLASPMEHKLDVPALCNELSNMALSPRSNFFFGDTNFNDRDCWEEIWRNKTCKESSKRKEILACVKLSGMNSKSLRHDGQFSCFVTVDNPGHIHVMNVMRRPRS